LASSAISIRGIELAQEFQAITGANIVWSIELFGDSKLRGTEFLVAVEDAKCISLTLI
jgi:hypothetical protein